MLISSNCYVAKKYFPELGKELNKRSEITISKFLGTGFSTDSCNGALNQNETLVEVKMVLEMAIEE